MLAFTTGCACPSSEEQLIFGCLPLSLEHIRVAICTGFDLIWG
jgi:hypothetical protein